MEEQRNLLTWPKPHSLKTKIGIQTRQAALEKKSYFYYSEMRGKTRKTKIIQ